jgi:hypothetical protein
VLGSKYIHDILIEPRSGRIFFFFPWELVVSKAEMVLMKRCLHLKTLLLKRMENDQVEMVEYRVLLLQG